MLEGYPCTNLEDCSDPKTALKRTLILHLRKVWLTCEVEILAATWRMAVRWNWNCHPETAWGVDAEGSACLSVNGARFGDIFDRDVTLTVANRLPDMFEK